MILAVTIPCHHLIHPSSQVMVANSLPELVEAMTSHALENGDGVGPLVQGKTKTWPVWIPIGSSYDNEPVWCFFSKNDVLQLMNG